jgi:hypothetical protein
MNVNIVTCESFDAFGRTFDDCMHMIADECYNAGEMGLALWRVITKVHYDMLAGDREGTSEWLGRMMGIYLHYFN